MFRYVLIASATLLAVSSAQAEPYSSTLNPEEQERHEFIDAQQNNYPSGRATGPAVAPQAARQGTPIIVQSTNPYIGVLPSSLNDRPVLTTTP